MKNEIFVPLPHVVQSGDIITDSQFQQNQDLYNELRTFCSDNFEAIYEIDRTMYARGIRVVLKSDYDVNRLHAWLDT